MRRPRRSALSALLLAGLLSLAAAASAADSTEVARARELIDGGRPEAAVPLLDRELSRHPKDAEALLLRSTAHFMLGDSTTGRRDLEHALQVDPTLRQGWLNLAGLAVAEERYDDALAAFARAEKLAPEAPENDLNIGTVLLLSGQLEPASQRFSRYLATGGASAEGYYLVAKNYALAGYEALAVEHLRRAIERDERARLRAKGDPNFTALDDNPRYRELVSTDAYTPPPGAHTAARLYPSFPYQGGRGPLLRAVLDALQLGDRPFDPRVEVTPDWALVWSDARIKLSDGPDGAGRVDLSAPAARFTPGEWERASDQLLHAVAGRLATNAGRPTPPPKVVPPDTP